jgi:hypothetical protein
MSAQRAFNSSARGLWAPEARAADRMSKQAFSSIAPALAGILNGELGRAPSSTRRDAYVHEFLMIHSAPALTRIGNCELGRTSSHALRGAYVREASLVQSAPYLLETSGLARGGMGGEQRARRSPSSTRMLANARKAPTTSGAPALLPSCSQWRFEKERGVLGLERCVEQEREREKLTNFMGSGV